jgi:hypothetical protein
MIHIYYFAPRDSFWRGFRAFNIFQVFYLAECKKLYTGGGNKFDKVTGCLMVKVM